MTKKRIEAFLAIADEELFAADKLKGFLPRQALYFLQQTVEKLIRAVLEFYEIPVGTSHNLLMIAGLLPSCHVLRLRFQEFEHLSSASTRYRYPSGTGAIYTVSVAEVEKTFIEVSKLRDEVFAYLKKAMN